MIRILIADDHPIVRDGLKQMLSSQADMGVAFEAQNAKELFEIVHTQKLDVIVLDINMPDRNGLEILTQLKKELPDLPVLILSVHSEEQYALRALKAGADGFLNKESRPEELIKAIRKVVEGGRYVSPSLAEKLALNLRKRDKPDHENLSDREFQIMCMIAKGKTLREIAFELYLSEKTVSTYRTRILEKMGLKTNADLTYYAVKNKLIE